MTNALVQRQPERLKTLDVLRGIAALAVTWFHFSRITPGVPPNSFLLTSGTYGWTGVEVFFMISGFVIPLSLQKAQYHVRDFVRFFAKRLVRLEPPYLASIVITLLVRLLLYGTIQHQTPVTMVNLLLHPFYLTGVFKLPWLVPVYWTLAVEIQFYILIGLAFPLVNRPILFWTIGAPVSVGLALALPFTGHVFFYLPTFLLGIAAFHFSIGRIGKIPFLALILLLGLVSLRLLHPYAVLAPVAAALAIVFIRRVPKILVALGAISYPLYLLHFPMGDAAFAFDRKFHITSPGLSAAIWIVASLMGAWLLHVLVEIPAQRWSARIRYKGREAAFSQTASTSTDPAVHSAP